MSNKTTQSDRNLLSGQLLKILSNKQLQKKETQLIRGKSSQKQQINDQYNLQKRKVYFKGRNSMENLELIFSDETTNKIKSPVIVITNRNPFVSSRISRKTHLSTSQEPIQSIPGIKKSFDWGYRIAGVKKEELKVICQKDPVSFTDWVERIYGKEWFY